MDPPPPPAPKNKVQQGWGNAERVGRTATDPRGEGAERVRRGRVQGERARTRDEGGARNEGACPRTGASGGGGAPVALWRDHNFCLSLKQASLVAPASARQGQARGRSGALRAALGQPHAHQAAQGAHRRRRIILPWNPSPDARPPPPPHISGSSHEVLPHVVHSLPVQSEAVRRVGALHDRAHVLPDEAVQLFQDHLHLPGGLGVASRNEKGGRGSMWYSARGEAAGRHRRESRTTGLRQGTTPRRGRRAGERGGMDERGVDVPPPRRVVSWRQRRGLGQSDGRAPLSPVWGDSEGGGRLERVRGGEGMSRKESRQFCNFLRHCAVHTALHFNESLDPWAIKYVYLMDINCMDNAHLSTVEKLVITAHTL